jgi:hypothetical protein
VATATEETVRDEQETWEAEQAAGDVEIDAETEPTDPDGKSLFDRAAYQAPGLRIDEVDGQEVDKIWLRFTGRVALDRTKTEDVALFNRARLGKELELRVSGSGVRVGTSRTTAKGGDLDAVVGEREIKVDTVYVLEPEELSA